jgi:hypothetical protein
MCELYTNELSRQFLFFNFMFLLRFTYSADIAAYNNRTSFM